MKEPYHTAFHLNQRKICIPSGQNSVLNMESNELAVGEGKIPDFMDQWSNLLVQILIPTYDNCELYP